MFSSSTSSCQAYSKTYPKANDQQRCEHQEANSLASSSFANNRTDGDKFVSFEGIGVKRIGWWHGIMAGAWYRPGEMSAVAPSAREIRRLRRH
jgi:hypothetical protein